MEVDLAHSTRIKFVIRLRISRRIANRLPGKERASPRLRSKLSIVIGKQYILKSRKQNSGIECK